MAEALPLAPSLCQLFTPTWGRGQTPTWVPIRQCHFLDVTLGKSISLKVSPLNNTCLTRVELDEVMWRKGSANGTF